MLQYVLPTTLSGSAIIILLLLWFAIWWGRLYQQQRLLSEAEKAVVKLDAYVGKLREYQRWLEHARQTGTLPENNDPSEYFGTVTADFHRSTKNQSGAFPVEDHLQTIFLAGCEESALDGAELSATTMQALQRPAQGLRLELGLFVLVGLLGTLLGLAETLGGIQVGNTPPDQLVASVEQILSGLGNAFAPAMWGVLTSILAGLRFAQFQAKAVNPCATALRRATNMKWVPKLYPTVGQKASQWALQTLQHAIKVTDAAKTIEEDTTALKESMSLARDAGDSFARAMRSFTKATSTADEVLANAVKNLGGEIDKFGHSLTRWSQFEEEIRRFYNAVEGHQADMAARQQHLEDTLEAHRSLLLDASGSLQTSAESVSATMSELPKNVESTVACLQQTAASFEEHTKKVIEKLAQAIADKSVGHEKQFTSTLSTHSKHLLSAAAGLQQGIGQLDASSIGVQKASMLFARGTEHLINHLSEQLLAQTNSLKSAHAAELSAFEHSLKETMLEHQLRLNAITQPVLSLEQRMGALAAPFDDAAYKLVEIATNLFKLNQTSVRELTAATGQVSAVVECLRIDRKSARRNKRFGRTVAIPFDEQTWGAGGQPITISKIHADGPVEEADAANGKL